MKPFFGYPGGKSKVAKRVLESLDLDLKKYKWYAEPFSGGFSMGLKVSDEADYRWLINEFDHDLYCLWVAVIQYPEGLCDRVNETVITPETFYELRGKLLCPGPLASSLLTKAIDKLVIHKISFSNMGEKSGSPVGGKNQTGKWKYDCRWNVDSICKQIMKVSARLAGARVTNWSYERVIKVDLHNMLLYIDPPYVEAGPKCYKHSFRTADHVKLRSTLEDCKHDWFMTYDNHPLIREMYADYNIRGLDFKYHMSSRGRSDQELKTGKELLISNF